MSHRFSQYRKPFLIWVIANMLGFGVLGIVLVLFPSLMSIPGMFASTLIISIPIAIAQWIALRQLFSVSILWILTVPVGFLLVIFIIREHPELLLPIAADDESPIAFAMIFFQLGLVIALPQWLLLRRHLPNSSIWLLGSSLGLALGFWLVLVTELFDKSPVISSIIAILFYAVSTGLILSWLLGNKDHLQSNVIPAT
ncbi:MAG: hypothetical protein JSW42_09685 [Chloroflexota bacterium]|nr:MAG: hypothetical protein JSW42_09685 [Chloroflexota bacterium]